MKSAGDTVDRPPSAEEERLRERDLLAVMPKKSASREARVGLFVLIGVIAFLTALFSLTDVGTFRGRYYVNTVIETAGGMRRGDPVQMRGVNIGRVSEFEMVPGGVTVRMEIYDQYDIPEDSEVGVRSAGLLGGMLVDIVPGNSPQRAADDQMLEGVVETDLLSSAGDLGTQAEEVLGRASLLLSRDNVGGVSTSISDLQLVLAELSGLAAQQRQELSALSQSLRRSAEGVERATTGPQLEQAVNNVEALTTRLDEATVSLQSASTSLDTVLGRLERGEGTLGRLTVDESLYDNLNSAVVSIQGLVTDIQANPSRYIDVSVF